ncbi:hypothetical protein BJ912DRAFT_1015169 [Pholiota molesta]|nr:hypothetical protein BJ912DRAFT_1015169 [Pholiota molesta]
MRTETKPRRLSIYGHRRHHPGADINTPLNAQSFRTAQRTASGVNTPRPRTRAFVRRASPCSNNRLPQNDGQPLTHADVERGRHLSETRWAAYPVPSADGREGKGSARPQREGSQTYCREGQRTPPSACGVEPRGGQLDGQGLVLVTNADNDNDNDNTQKDMGWTTDGVAWTATARFARV